VTRRKQSAIEERGAAQNRFYRQESDFLGRRPFLGKASARGFAQEIAPHAPFMGRRPILWAALVISSYHNHLDQSGEGENDEAGSKQPRFVRRDDGGRLGVGRTIFASTHRDVGRVRRFVRNTIVQTQICLTSGCLNAEVGRWSQRRQLQARLTIARLQIVGLAKQMIYESRRIDWFALGASVLVLSGAAYVLTEWARRWLFHAY
jgi:hypothetical protein